MSVSIKSTSEEAKSRVEELKDDFRRETFPLNQLPKKLKGYRSKALP